MAKTSSKALSRFNSLSGYLKQDLISISEGYCQRARQKPTYLHKVSFFIILRFEYFQIFKKF